MPTDDRLRSSHFPRSNAYHPDWVMKNGMGSNPLWIAEWLASAMELKTGTRVLDLGCGRAVSSIFLAREYGVQVWAVDLWISASENLKRIHDAQLENQVFPIHCDARGLPFAGEYFDAIVSLDSFMYYGTDDLYLNYLTHFVKPGGQLGIAMAGLTKELEGGVPEHLREFWSQDIWSLHSAAWWRRHWERTGIVDVELSETMPEGHRVWLDWHLTAHPENQTEIAAIEADHGEYLGYIRMVAQRRSDAKLEEYCWPDTMKSFPSDYETRPLLRS